MTIKGSAFVFVTASLLYLTIRRLVQFVQLTSEALRRSNRELRAISTCNQVLLRATDEQSLLKEICRIVCEEAGYRAAWVGYAEHDEAKGVRHVAWTGVEEGVLARLGLTWADTELGRGPCGTAIRTGKTSCIEDCVTDSRVAPWKEIASRNIFRSVVALPLKDEQANTFGCLIIYAAQPNAFTSEEIRLLEELAGDLAFGIVTLRSRAARERAEQEVSLLSFALDNVHEAAFLLDGARLCYVNEEACRRLGYTREELLGMGIADIDPDFPVERWSEHWHNLKARRSLTFESRHRTREGRIFPVEVSANYFEYGGRAYNLALVRDITERKRAEDERRESAERFRAIADYTYDWENWFGVDGKLLWVNPAVERITGYSVAECMAMPNFPLPIVAQADRESLAQQVREAVDGSSRNDFEFRVRHKDGRLVWVAASWQPIYDSRGPRLGHRSSMRDITERKRAEEALRRSEANLNRAQEIAHIGSWHLDLVCSLLTWSDEVFRIFDMPRDTALTYESFLNRVHPDDRERVDRAWAAALQGAPYDIEHRILVGDGLKWIRERAEVEFDTQRKAVRGTGTVQDITERKRAEDEVRQTAAQWQATFDAVQDLVLLLDKDFQIVRANRAAAELLKLPFDRIVGEHCFSLIHGTSMAPAECPLARMRQSRRHEEEEVLAREGGPWLLVSADPVFDQSGELTHVVHVARDITERKRAEDELRRREAYLAETQRLTHTGTAVADPTGEPLYYSEELFRLLGFDPKQGLPTADQAMQRIHPEDSDKFVQAFQGAIDDRADVDIEYRVVLPDGTVKLMHGIGHPIFNAGGELIEIVVTTVDITERKRAEDELRQIWGYLAETQRLTHTGTSVADPTTAPVYWSEEMFRIFGFDPQQGLPTRDQPLQRIHPEDRDKFQQAFQRAIHDKVDSDVEYRVMLPDGTFKHIYGLAHPVLNASGELVEVVCTVVDVTERKRAEEALRRSEANLAEGQRLSHAGSWVWNPATLQTLHWSEEMFRIFGFNPQDGVPSADTFWQRIHPDDLDRVREMFVKVARRSMDYEHDHRIVLPDGTIKHIHAIGHPVHDEAGNLVEYIGTAMDVTERMLAEDELRKHRENLEDMVRHRTEQLADAKSRAEAANRAKSTFLSNMSHELRTPLNAVLGFSRLLKNDPDVTPQQQETLDVIVRSGEHLLNLINNVLDMAKIESGRVALKESEVDLRRLLHEMQSLMGVGAVEKGLRFALEDEPDLPRFVAVDTGKLRQVLLNLLGNAIKYTDSGGVKLRAKLAGIHGSEKANVRFEVEDSGSGIPQEDCQRIFIPFVQLGDRAPAQAGTGLGLAICKQYVDLMGGQIGVTSQPGKGSVFYFEIPVTLLTSVAERDELKHPRILGLAEGQPRHRLLIVEDQSENRLLLRKLLAPLGFELREAANGQEAVALFEQWHPDLIWMDIRMPVMDGLEAVRRIRATQAGADTKVIALTAHALEEEREPIIAAGCDDLVRKPFHEQELFGALARHLHLKFIYEKAPRPENTPEPPELPLTPEQLDALPAHLLQELRQTVIELDTARTQVLIGQVAERDASLGRALTALASQFDYPRLLKLLEKEHPETGPML